MSLCTLLLPLLLLASTATASHFYGGMMTFTPKEKNSDGSYRVKFYFKDGFHNCETSNPWRCSNCGIGTSFEIGRIDGNTNGNANNRDWCQTEGVITRSIFNISPFDYRQTSVAWIANVISSGSWFLLTHVDLGVRSDTMEPNKSPLTTIIPFIRVPQNCPRTYSLLAHDPDGDQVRCRFAVILRTDCGICNQPSGFHLDQSSCSLSYNATALSGTYTFELVEEDFPIQNITLSYRSGSSSQRDTSTPLSKIPLQFALRVDPNVTSCTEGVFLPRFLPPTPYNGEHLFVRDNQTLEIRVKATAANSAVTTILVSGPLGITKNQTAAGEFVIQWTPDEDDREENFPVCFIAEAESGSSIYQSEMRCVIVKVTEKVQHVLGLRVKLTSERDLSDAVIKDLVLQKLTEEFIKLGLPSSITMRLRNIQKTSP